ncbi:hemerythrin domain-containing protein [Vulgatibacter incomptus]|uniref:Hemerythrin-like domain-containing protein n=1 Tax=Vulgatibacter incomptus TaxID=1391653 RepID=A0A0K1PCB2_9BACT|nr:hemerythrin domain-containing protein [Vulgatibacter incomptus]AKU91160.1 hypothetical protein AKJ08_1547 [Vulgatibacter incomptus]
MIVRIGGGREELADLVDLLLDCHARIRSFAALARIAGERADATHAEVVDACERVERYFGIALPLHVADEEESILPRLRGVSPEVDRALADMHAQHAAHQAGLHAMLSASAAVRQDPGDAAKRATLVAAAAPLEREFAEHLALEETVLFPAIRREWSADVQAEVVRELRARRA